jgi:type II secretory pathway component PulK
MILQNQKGVAILMVLTSVALLALVLAEFSFDTTVHSLKVYNQQDQYQARLNAEAGINMSMARLRMYQEGRNLLEKNESLKGVIQPSQIESILLQPFMYPIQLPPRAGSLQRSALQDFEKEVLFRGELLVTIKQVSGFLNPNNMRLSVNAKEDDNDNDDNLTAEERAKKNPALFVEDKLIETLTRLIEEERLEDALFDTKYGNLDIELLIKEIKYYISDADKFEDVERGEIEARFLALDLIPKHAPLSSIDELYLLPSWDDEIIDMFKVYLTVHEPSIIAVNELTEDQLKILFPDITPIQIEEFYKYRLGDPEREIEPQEFKSPEDFKNVITNVLGIMGSGDYDERIKEFEAAGLKIGVAGKLFEVTSEGKMGRASVKLVAFVDLPIMPKAWTPPTPGNDPGAGQPNPDFENDQNPPEGDGEQEKKPISVELLPPRVIEMRLD